MKCRNPPGPRLFSPNGLVVKIPNNSFCTSIPGLIPLERGRRVTKGVSVPKTGGYSTNFIEGL